MLANQGDADAVANQVHNKLQSRATGFFKLLQIYDRTLAIDDNGNAETIFIDSVCMSLECGLHGHYPSTVQLTLFPHSS